MESIEKLRKLSETGELTAEAARQQIEARQHTVSHLIGYLYPDVLRGEINELEDFLAGAEMRPSPEKAEEISKKLGLMPMDESLVTFDQARKAMDNIAMVHCLDPDWNTMMRFIDQREEAARAGAKT